MEEFTDEELAYACGYRDGFHRAIELMNEQTEQLINQMGALKEDKIKHGGHKEENGDC